MDESKIPAGIPPPGVTPNFINPTSRRVQIDTVAIALPAVALLFIFLRLYTRIFVSRAFGLDDGMFFAALPSGHG